jgi:hypothetical protein
LVGAGAALEPVIKGGDAGAEITKFVSIGEWLRLRERHG